MSAESLPTSPFEIQAALSRVVFHTEKESMHIDLHEKDELPDMALRMISRALHCKAVAVNLLESENDPEEIRKLHQEIAIGDTASYILQIRYYYLISEFKARFHELTKLVNDPVGILTQGLLNASASYKYERRPEFKPYAMTCMRNAIVDDGRRVHYKYEVPLPQRDEDEVEFGLGAAHSVEDTLLPQLQLEYILDRVQNENSPMPAQQRQCLLAFIQYPHHSQAEIASILEISESSFKSSLFRARNSLKQMLGVELIQDLLC